ncbi:MAG: NAD-dependent epimerase/dehydratase family protein [Patescibacteria group bacterium]|jgi:UDP-glucose 4-epimerase
MKILVTGGAGFIGSHLVDTLVQDGHQILVVDDLSTGSKAHVNKQAKLAILDINNQKLASLMSDFAPEVIYHLAAQKNVRVSLENPVLDAKINILGSLNILEQAIKNKVKKFIFVSTAGIYGDTEILPTDEAGPEQAMSPYILNKLTFEKYLAILAQDKIKWVSARLANVYGPRQDPKGEAGVIAILLNDAIKNNIFYAYGDGHNTRDYIYVADIVHALRDFLEQAEGIYNVGTSLETSLLDLIAIIREISGSDFPVEHSEAIAGEVKRSSLDSHKIKRDLNWQSEYDLKQGLKLTYRWFKDNK